jgi:integrase
MDTSKVTTEKKKRKKGKRGLGSVRWREDIKKYVIDYYDRLGKRHVETVGTNMHEAADKLNQKMYEIRKGTYNPDRSNKTFKEFADQWLSGKIGIKQATYAGYESNVRNHLIPYFGESLLADIRREDIRNFVKMKTEAGKHNPKTIHNFLLVLHQILTDAQVEGLISNNPYIKIERPKANKPDVDYLRTHEIPILLKACEEVGRMPIRKVTSIVNGHEEEKKAGLPVDDTTLHAIFFTAIFTGMRRGEFLALKWEDVDWVNHKIHVRRSLYRSTLQTPKSDYSKRAIDMGPRLEEVLKNHRKSQNQMKLKTGRAWHDNDFIFCNDDGSSINAENLYHRRFKRIIKKAGLRSIRIHDLRHTFASILIAAGHNIKYIQSQLGHSSIKITLDIYGHLMPEVYEGAAKRSEDFVFGNGNEKVNGNVMVTQRHYEANRKTEHIDNIE